MQQTTRETYSYTVTEDRNMRLSLSIEVQGIKIGILLDDFDWLIYM